MKKLIALLLLICCISSLAGCSRNEPIKGTEEIYLGIVADRAMSVVNEGDRQGRAYISIELENGTSKQFWLANNYESDAKNGDYVEIESAVEDKTNLLIATKITVLEVEQDQQGTQTGQTSSARLLSVDVKVIEVVNDTTFAVEALADCPDKINIGDTISVTTDFESVADILENYPESNHFKIYFPNVGETGAGLSLTCFDAVQYDADGKPIVISDY